MKVFCVIVVMLISVSTHLWAMDYQGIVDQHRKMLVLVEGTSDIDPRSESIFAARNYYVEKHEKIQEVLDQAEKNSQTSGSDQVLSVTGSFIEFWGRSDIHDGDRLAFLDLVEDLLLIEQGRGVNFNAIQPLKFINSEMAAILDAYGEEYSKSLEKLGARGTGTRELWHEYIEFLKTLFDYDDLIKQVSDGNGTLYKEETRGTGLAKDQKDELKPQAPKIIWGNGLPDKTVVLTFDDGPHESRTNAILDILKQYKVNGYFFTVGKNIGTIQEKGEVKLSSRKKVAQRIINEGHGLGNHSYSHAVLTKLDYDARKKELDDSNSLIKTSTGSNGIVFRPPYGSKDDALMKLVMEEGMISVMWNIDSLDWSDPVPASIADRVLRTLDEQGKGILLFHDIHKQTVNALPDILKGLALNGYKVVSLDGQPFINGQSGIPQIPDAHHEEAQLYSKRWAVVIGINEYQHWPDLKYAVNDAQSVGDTLRTKLGFAKENIIEIYDEEATRGRITEVLGYELADPQKVGENDCVFVFYAGHGMTRPLSAGNNLGYIIPSDTELKKFQVQGISMSQIDDFCMLIPAKHVYFVMDSCYSGLALTRAGITMGQTKNYLNQITSRRARQILTAGGADEQVADGGPDGHSVFTWTLLQGLEGMADTDNNGYVTASELGTYVAPVVASYADQTPAFGNLLGSKGGDFVFQIDSKAVEAINAKLINETQLIEAELKALNNNPQAVVKRRLELALEKAKQRGVSQVSPEVTDVEGEKQAVSDDRKIQARRLNASAMQYFKEKKYKLARAEWAEAVHLNPYNPTIVNNYGYVLDKLEENEEALKWYYRTVELEPTRTVIYMNLGNLMVELGRLTEAIPYFERYLHLYPSYENREELQKNIENLKQGLKPEKVFD